MPEILAAVRWAKTAFKNPDDLLRGGPSVSLDSILDPALLAGARRVLENIGKPDAPSICLDDVADRAKIFALAPFNGDGVFPPEHASDPADRAVLEEIVATVGGPADFSGKLGANQAKTDAFFAEAKALVEWEDKAAADPGLFPVGREATLAAVAAVQAVEAKIDDYFARCRLAAFDPRALTALNRVETDYLVLAAKDLSVTAQEMAGFPIARVEPGRPIPLLEGVNPAWAAALAALASAATPLLGGRPVSLSGEEWTALKARLAPCAAWLASKPASPVERLGLPRLRAILASPAKTRIDALLLKDLAVQAELAQVASVEKLLLFQRDLARLLNNFVNFSEFYGRKNAIFQAGTLYLDGRSCNLCVQVTDTAKHAALAGLAATYLAYCDCTRPGGEKMTVAAAFTDGDSDNLIVGRNGVFYDRKGRDWDAAITKIVPNPISIREAFWSPYKKLARLVEEQIAKRAAAAEADSTKALSETAEQVVKADKTAPAAKTAALASKKIDVGTVAAVGVALGSIGGFLAALATKFLDLGLWMPIGVTAVMLMISGPSMLLAYLKLRQRNLGPILDANGWAINGRARINVPFGGALTDMAALPPGSERTTDDPYAEKKRPWRTILAALLLIATAWCWYVGKLDNYIPVKSLTSESVLGENAPVVKATIKAGARSKITITQDTNAPAPAAK